MIDCGDYQSQNQQEDSIVQNRALDGDRRRHHVCEAPWAMSMKKTLLADRRGHAFLAVFESVTGSLNRIVVDYAFLEDFCSEYVRSVTDVDVVSWEMVSVMHLNDWKISISIHHDSFWPLPDFVTVCARVVEIWRVIWRSCCCGVFCEEAIETLKQKKILWRICLDH